MNAAAWNLLCFRRPTRSRGQDLPGTGGHLQVGRGFRQGHPYHSGRHEAHEFLEAQVDQEVRRALNLNEPRIQVKNVDVERKQDARREYSVIQITVGYNIRGQYIETAITQQVQGG